MAYVPDPTNIAFPTDAQPAESAQAEFRALKAYIASLAGLGGGINFFRKNRTPAGEFGRNPWQRGTAYVSPLSGVYSADRWLWLYAGSGIVNINRGNGPGVVAGVGYFTYDLEITVTTADAAIAAGDNYTLDTRIEGFDALPLYGGPITVSFLHRHSKVGTYCVALRNAGPDRSCIKEYTQIVANAWETSQVTFPTPDLTGTWNFGNGLGLELSFPLAIGSTFQIAAGNWQAGNFLATANQVNAMDTVGNVFRLAGVQTEAGSVASPYEWILYNELMDHCQRYFEIVNMPGAWNWWAGDGNTQNKNAYFRTKKRIAPAVVQFSGLSSANLGAVSYLGTVDSVQISANPLASPGICALNGLVLYANAEL